MGMTSKTVIEISKKNLSNLQVWYNNTGYNKPYYLCLLIVNYSPI